MNNTKKEPVLHPELKMRVYHEDIHGGQEVLTIVGIREKEVELQAELTAWMPIKGLFRYRKICPEHQKPEGCQLNNVQCSYPDCEPYVELNEPKDELLFLNEFKIKTPKEVLKPYVEQIFRHSRIVSEENALKAIEEYHELYDNHKRNLNATKALFEFLKTKFKEHAWKLHQINYEDYYISCDNKEFLKSEVFLEFYRKLFDKLIELDIYLMAIIHSSEPILEDSKEIK